MMQSCSRPARTVPGGWFRSRLEHRLDAAAGDYSSAAEGCAARCEAVGSRLLVIVEEATAGRAPGQAEQRQHLSAREQQAEAGALTRRLLSEQRAQFVSRLCR